MLHNYAKQLKDGNGTRHQPFTIKHESFYCRLIPQNGEKSNIIAGKNQITRHGKVELIHNSVCPVFIREMKELFVMLIYLNTFIQPNQA